MAVDFAFKKAPSYRVASISWKGPWSDASVHAHFLRVEKWAAARKLRTGKWIFREPDEREFETAIEVKGPCGSEGGVRVKTFPASTVASVVFDPRVVEPRVVYHGLTDFLRWRKKDHTIRSVGSYREVYLGDPWKDTRAFARTDVQILVRK
jgi:effector-binding domain-containing protein